MKSFLKSKKSNQKLSLLKPLPIRLPLSLRYCSRRVLPAKPGTAVLIPRAGLLPFSLLPKKFALVLTIAFFLFLGPWFLGGYKKFRFFTFCWNGEVASFEYNPATKNQPLLFGLTKSVEDLEDELLLAFSGKTKTMENIYLEHNVGTPFIKSNYKKALVNLENKGKIEVSIPISQRRKNTFADHLLVTFPKTEGASHG